MAIKIAKESPNLIDEKMIHLRRLFPHCFSEGSFNFDTLRKELGLADKLIEDKYTLTWTGKDNVFKIIQLPSQGTLIPNFDKSLNFDSTGNIFIEGDNLEVLKLIQKSYYEKIKVIYIDPPYNTGNDFLYRDNFQNTIQSYLEQTGQTHNGIKLITNPETNGRFHSDWLNMIYPRLFLARNLLRDDGLIFVSIDDNEVHNLRLIMNEIFGEENFVISIVWKKRSGPPNDKIIGSVHENILCYPKNSDNKGLFRKERTEEQLNRYKNPDNHPKGPWTPGDLMANIKGGRYVQSLYFPIVNPDTGEEHYPSSDGNWRFNKSKIKELMDNKEIYFGNDGKGRPKLKRFLCDVKEGVPFPSIWDNLPYNNRGSEEIGEIFGNINIFDTAKPTDLIKQILLVSTKKDDNEIILDFFAGSGTTAHAVLAQNNNDGGNRKFIIIQIPERINENTTTFKAGFKTISDLCLERIRKVSSKMIKDNLNKLDTNEKIDHGFKVFKLNRSNFKSWEYNEMDNVEELKKQLKLFEMPLVEDYKDMDVIYECIIKEGYSFNSKIEKLNLVSNIIVYKVIDNENHMLITLDKEIKSNIIEKLNLEKESVFVCLDSALNDTEKANLTEKCILKTI